MNPNFAKILFQTTVSLLEKKYAFNKNEYYKEKDISIELLNSNEFNISYVNELLEYSIKEQNNYDLLLDLSSFAKPTNLGILGFLVMNSENIFDALNILCRYYVLIGKSIKPVVIETSDYIKLSIYSNKEDKGLVNLEKYKTLIHLFAVINLIQDLTKQEIKPEFINLLQESILDLNTINGTKINFQEDENAIYFNKNIKKIKNDNYEAKQLEYYKKLAQEHLDLNFSDESFKTRVSALVFASIIELDISLESISTKVKLHPRVLQKRLKEENSSFSKILEDVRKKLCIYYLQKGLDIPTIAIYLSYSEVNSLFRSFKKWYGMTPKQWLKKNSNFDNK